MSLRAGHRIVVFGATGRMGSEVCKTLVASSEHQYLGSIKRSSKQGELPEAVDPTGQPVDLHALLKSATAAIDFSLPAAVDRHVELCRDHGVPYACGVTALTLATQERLRNAGLAIPVLWAPNMSTGVTLCFGAAADIASRLVGEFSVSITDIHHAGKQDAPSGTALEFGRTISEAASRDIQVAYESIREGHHPGEHHIVFHTGADHIELRHKAADRGEFAIGAVRAAQWLGEQPSGFYNMRNVLGITTSS